MKNFVPSYYNSFRCIADKCPDTCCAGWDIVVDADAEKLYLSADGSIGEKLKNNIITDSDGDRIFKRSGKSCPFLKESGLCELYIELGEEALCYTCKRFPRFFEHYGSFAETGLGFACPEAARIILSEPSPLTLCEEEINEEEYEADDLTDILLAARNKMLTITNESSSIKETCEKLLEYAQTVQEEIDGCFSEADAEAKSFDDCIDMLSQAEYIEESRRDYILSLRGKTLTSRYIGNDFKRLTEYYIFRYALSAVFDYDFLTKIKLGVFACAVLGRIYADLNPDFNGRVKIMAAFSKEAEYSQDNLDLIEEFLLNTNCKSLAELL